MAAMPSKYWPRRPDLRILSDFVRKIFSSARGLFATPLRHTADGRSTGQNSLRETRPGNNNLMKTVHSLTFGLASLFAFAFTTTAAQAPVDLGAAGDYVILSKTGISTTGMTAIVGNVGTSPIDATGLTGFTLSLDVSNVFATSPLITGQVFASDFAIPTPTNLTTAVSDMLTAFTDAAGRNLPDTTELGAGNISGLTLAPGLHKWGTGLLINSSVTFEGDADAVWILQIAENLLLANGASVQLSGGAQAGNIFWQVAGEANLGTTSNFQGILLSQTGIHAQTGATITGRLLAQTAVTLDSNQVTANAAVAESWNWFGTVEESFFDSNLGHGWILHAEHGWLYLQGNSQMTWVWDYIRAGWFWTSATVYPLFYNPARGHWDYYLIGGTHEMRWFFLNDPQHPQAGTWLGVSSQN